MNSMDEAKSDAFDEAYALRDRSTDKTEEDELLELSQKMDELKKQIDMLAYKRTRK